MVNLINKVPEVGEAAAADVAGGAELTATAPAVQNM